MYIYIYVYQTVLNLYHMIYIHEVGDDFLHGPGPHKDRSPGRYT